jgi:FkbM family methyltransferase
MGLEPKIKLDFLNIFALNTFSRNVNEFYLNSENKLVSHETSVIPCFIHDNGWNHGSPKYNNHFELKRLYSDSYPHLKNISIQRPIGQIHQDYLINLRDNFGFIPNVTYDVGACVLHWTTIAKEVWPNSQYVLFEAMEESEELFQETNHPYHIGVFSDVDDKEITFYKNVTFPGGNSYYMENPQHSSMASVLFENPANQFKRKTITLDTVRRMKNLPFPDLLKIDVQGCEIDILRGATEILQNVKHLIIELQHVEYNIGAQMCDDSIPIIEAMGFELVTPKFSLSSHADADYHFKRKEI